MKKLFPSILIATLLLLSTIYTSCKKEAKDTTAPVITIDGLPTCYLQRGRVYYDAGATAKDATDGTVKVTSTNNVNPNVIGTYNYTYTATDQAGNVGTATRIVYVVDLEGTYTNCTNFKPYPVLVSSDSSHYGETLFLSVDMTGQLNFNVFGNNVNGLVASYLSSGTSLSIPVQTVNCGSPNIPRTFSGSGYISNPTAHTKIVIDYREVSDTIHPHCRGVYTKD